MEPRQCDARTYELLQAAALLKLYALDTGRAADEDETTADFQEWCRTATYERPIDPFAILDAHEIAEALREGNADIH
jgi:hypothetical protein